MSIGFDVPAMGVKTPGGSRYSKRKVLLIPKLPPHSNAWRWSFQCTALAEDIRHPPM